MGAGSLLALSPQIVFADTSSDLAQTESDLDDAQARLDQVQAQLDQIAAEYTALAQKQAQTLDQIEAKQGEIDATQEQIDQKQTDLEEKQDRLAKRVSSSYKTGDNDVLSVMLNSTSMNDLTSNLYYLSKISDQDRRLIEEVKSAKEALDQQKAQLEDEKAELEKLNDQQKQQLADMQAKQQEVTDTLNGLSDQVKQLMAQRDQELEQMAAEKAAQEKAAREAAAAAAASSSASATSSSASKGSAASGVTGTVGGGGAQTGSQQAVINACHSTPSPGAGYCAMWVSQVFSRAGLGYPSGNANDMYNAWCTSSNKAALKPGMIIAVSTHSHSKAGSVFGHVGIYIGGGTVMHNIGSVSTMGLDQWISYYGTTVTPRWGWIMGKALS